jgi:hypothetical protein
MTEPPSHRFRGLTLHQPWASLMAWGVKSVETRPWKVEYRGPMVIHAAKAFQPYAQQVCMMNLDIRRVLLAKMHEAGICRDNRITLGRLHELLPLGKIVATTRLVDVVTTNKIDADRIFAEFAYGNFAKNRWMWMCQDTKALARPIVYTGMQGLWYLDPAYEELVA